MKYELHKQYTSHIGEVGVWLVIYVAPCISSRA